MIDTSARCRVRELTSQVLKTGHVDPRGVEDVVRSVTESKTARAEPDAELCKPVAGHA